MVIYLVIADSNVGQYYMFITAVRHLQPSNIFEAIRAIFATLRYLAGGGSLASNVSLLRRVSAPK
jgi:hypothetical protein